MIGQTLDHYRIESKLGEGGMGVVYKARDIHLDRLVAIKVLPPDKVADATRKQRFVREARAAVHEQGIYYIVHRSNETKLEFYDLVKGRSSTIASNLGTIAGGLAVSPDGRTILYSRVDSSVADLMLVENFR